MPGGINSSRSGRSADLKAVLGESVYFLGELWGSVSPHQPAYRRTVLFVHFWRYRILDDSLSFKDWGGIGVSIHKNKLKVTLNCLHIDGNNGEARRCYISDVEISRKIIHTQSVAFANEGTKR